MRLLYVVALCTVMLSAVSCSQPSTGDGTPSAFEGTGETQTEAVFQDRVEAYTALVESYIEDADFRTADSDRVKFLSDRLRGHYDVIGRTDGGDREYYVAVRRSDAPVYDDFDSIHVGYLDDQLFVGYYDKNSDPVVLYDLSGYTQLDMPFGYENLDSFCFGISGKADTAERRSFLYAFDQRGRELLDFIKSKPGLTLYSEGRPYVQFYYQDEDTVKFSSEPYACYIEITGGEQETISRQLLNSEVEVGVGSLQEALDYLRKKGNICSTGASLLVDGLRYQSFGAHDLPGYLLVTTEEQSDFLSLEYNEEIYRFLLEKVRTVTGRDYGNFDSDWFKKPLKSAAIVFPEYKEVNGKSDMELRTQTVEDRDRLNALSELMARAVNSGENYGFSACPFNASIDFIREDGEELRVFIATDSCDSMTYEGRIEFEYGSQEDLAVIFDEAMALRLPGDGVQ